MKDYFACVKCIALISCGPVMALALVALRVGLPFEYQNIIEGLLFLGVVIWFVWAFGNTKQSRWDLYMVRMQDQPGEVGSLLKRSTRRGHLINVVLLKCFRNTDSTLNQTELVERAQRKMKIQEADMKLDRERLSRGQIVEYIEMLVKRGLIEIAYTGHETRYRLGEEGKKYRNIADFYFPSRNLVFYLRNGLGMALPE